METYNSLETLRNEQFRSYVRIMCIHIFCTEAKFLHVFVNIEEKSVSELNILRFHCSCFIPHSHCIMSR